MPTRPDAYWALGVRNGHNSYTDDPLVLYSRQVAAGALFQTGNPNLGLGPRAEEDAL